MADFSREELPAHLLEAMRGALGGDAISQMLQSLKGTEDAAADSNAEEEDDDEQDEFDTIVIDEHHSFQLCKAENDFNADKKTLFATMIWNASRVLATYLLRDLAEDINAKTVIEFGSGAGMPSLMCSRSLTPFVAESIVIESLK